MSHALLKAGDLIDADVPVRGHTTKKGTYVKPHSEKRKRLAAVQQALDLWHASRPGDPQYAKIQKTDPYQAPPDLVLSDIKHVGMKTSGSNPGGIYQDDIGDRWLVKGSLESPGEEVGRNEVLAMRLYREMGIAAPRSQAVDLQGRHGGGIGIAVEFFDDVREAETKEEEALFFPGFVADCWLANWDVAANPENMMILPGVGALRADCGGTMLYRARGGKRGDAFGPIVGELSSMRKHAYRNIPKDLLEIGARKVVAMTDEIIQGLCTNYGAGSMETRKDLANTLIARREYIRQHVLGEGLMAKGAIIFLKARIKGANVADMSGDGPTTVEKPVQVSGHTTKTGTYVKPHVEKRQRVVEPPPAPPAPEPAAPPTVEQMDALLEYTGTYYREISRYLRGPGEGKAVTDVIQESSRRIIAALDAYIESRPPISPTKRLFRGIGPKAQTALFKAIGSSDTELEDLHHILTTGMPGDGHYETLSKELEKLSERCKGNQFLDLGFVSTSARSKIASDFAPGRFLVVISCDGSIKGLDVESEVSAHASISKLKVPKAATEESEYLLPRNARFELTGFSLKKGKAPGFGNDHLDRIILHVTARAPEPITKAILLFLKARIKGANVADMFDDGPTTVEKPVQVAGHTTKTGTYVKPHVEKRQRTVAPPPPKPEPPKPEPKPEPPKPEPKPEPPKPPKPTPEQIEALEGYCYNDYLQIGPYMRTGNYDAVGRGLSVKAQLTREQLDARIAALESLAEAAPPLPPTLKLYRGLGTTATKALMASIGGTRREVQKICDDMILLTRANRSPADEAQLKNAIAAAAKLSERLKGTVVEDAAFVSTSKEDEVAKRFGFEITLELSCPDGSVRGLDVLDTFEKHYPGDDYPSAADVEREILLQSGVRFEISGVYINRFGRLTATAAVTKKHPT